MKTTLSFLLLMCTFISTLALPQAINPPWELAKTEYVSKEVWDLDCPNSTVYGQTPNNTGIGTEALMTSPDNLVMDNVVGTAPGNVNSLTFWLAGEFTEAVEERNFNFIFQEDDGNGWPGTVIASFSNVIAQGYGTGEFFSGREVYEFTYNFPVIMLPEGSWVGFGKYLLSSEITTWQLGSSDGDHFMVVYDPDIGEYIELYPEVEWWHDLAFCLGYDAPPIPLRDWAVYIGIALMIGFIIIRFRRIF